MRTGNSEPEENVEPAAKRRKVNKQQTIKCKLQINLCKFHNTNKNLKGCFVLKNLFKLLF